jgi:hypothetical protein
VSEIFREIDEELRRDNLLKLWQRHSKLIITVVVVIFLAGGGFAAWRQHQQTELKALSTRYFGALSAIGAGKNADAEKMFGDLAQTGGGYALLARFEQAGLMANAGDRAGAIGMYDAIAKSSGVDPEFRDLATLMSAMHRLPDTDPKTVIADIAPLTESGKPWRASALELTAAADLKAGDKPAALKIYKQLADDLSAPEGLRSRAAELAAALAP